VKDVFLVLLLVLGSTKILLLQGAHFRSSQCANGALLDVPVCRLMLLPIYFLFGIIVVFVLIYEWIKGIGFR
jgi:hypothetical protein